MRTSTLARAGAVLTASALALSLGTGPVSAAESQTSTAAAAPSVTSASAGSFSASPIGSAAVPTGPARFGSGIITPAATTRFVGSGSFAGTGGATATVIVNGAAKGNVAVLFSQTTPGAIAVDVPRAWGSGRVQVTINGIASNTFYARKLVTTTRRDGYALKINRRNSKMTFKAREVKVINPSNGQFQSVKRVKLQRYKGGKWKSIKTIKLNRSGNGTYRTSIRTKYRYRLYSTRTATQEKFSTIRTKNI